MYHLLYYVTLSTQSSGKIVNYFELLSITQQAFLYAIYSSIVTFPWYLGALTTEYDGTRETYCEITHTVFQG